MSSRWWGAVKLWRMLVGSLDDENEKNAAAERPATAAKTPLGLGSEPVWWSASEFIFWLCCKEVRNNELNVASRMASEEAKFHKEKPEKKPGRSQTLSGRILAGSLLLEPRA